MAKREVFHVDLHSIGKTSKSSKKTFKGGKSKKKSSGGSSRPTPRPGGGKGKP